MECDGRLGSLFTSIRFHMFRLASFISGIIGTELTFTKWALAILEVLGTRDGDI